MERTDRETYIIITLMLREEEDALVWLGSHRGLFQCDFCML